MGSLTTRMYDGHILASLAEDVPSHDISADAVVPEQAHAAVTLRSKQDGVIAGLDVFKRTFQLVDSGSTWHLQVADGDFVHDGQVLGRGYGNARALLMAERTALNYLQRMSGIATCTAQMVEAMGQTKAVLVDTRKTTPGMRMLEKEAVRIGGGVNHRLGLSDCIMLKDNHIGAAGGIVKALALAHKNASFAHKIEIEVENLEDAALAVDAGADIIMLDNMAPDQVAEAVRVVAGRALVECSGNITLENIGDYARTGVDVISCGALTHSAGILDVSMKDFRLLDE